MRSVGFSQTDNNSFIKKVITISAILVISACSPLSNRLDGPIDGGQVYPIADNFVTNSIPENSNSKYSSSSRDYASNRKVSSSTLDPIESYDTNVANPIRPDRSANGVIRVRSGDTLLGVARDNRVDAVDLAELNSLEPPYVLKTGDELVLPGTVAAKRVASKRKTSVTHVATANIPQKSKSTTRVTSQNTARSASKRLAKNKPSNPTKTTNIASVPSPKPKKQKVASASPKSTTKTKVAASPKKAKTKTSKQSTKVAAVKTTTSKKTAVKDTQAKVASNSSNSFRWPVKGRVISEYGSKSNGAKNDGINLSVPKGAAIVAAESGVVVYSGNELRGYGNLVLIRHNNGWSTAYAHISKMLVKKGQNVRRGQVIAKVGQTGSVSRPQLHFELRRGTTPVNPRKYLKGPKVASR